jgi:hypothetical protein
MPVMSLHYFRAFHVEAFLYDQHTSIVYRSDEEERHSFYKFILREIGLQASVAAALLGTTGAGLPQPVDAAPAAYRPVGRPPLKKKDEAIGAVLAMLRAGKLRSHPDGKPVQADVERALAERLGREPSYRRDGEPVFDGTVRRYAKEVAQRYGAE